MKYSNRILICPLDWGLGHASRCIPIIRLLLQKKAEVIIAADGRPLELLKKEFPQLHFVQFKGYNISYSESGSLAMKMLITIPKILAGIKSETRELNKIIDQYKIDIVISDNRYGCWSKKVKSVFITHQLMIKSPIGESILHKIILSFIKKYNECWIPDAESTTSNFSGDLSHKYPLPRNAFFIGTLSRFNSHIKSFASFDLMAIISGPEPQRTKFQQMISEQISNNNLNAIIVCGLPESRTETKQTGTVKIYDHLNSEEMENAISNSKVIISRSGYSTIMDLARLNKKAIFIPTPGQTEQEYLSEILMKNKIAYSQSQSTFDLASALKETENYTGFTEKILFDRLQERIDKLF